MLSSFDHHQLLVFWVQLLVIVGAAKAMGAMMRRIGHPTVVGELLAGILLGPSVLGRVWPAGFQWVVPGGALHDPHKALLDGALLGISSVGVAMLLVVTGFETDLGLIRKFGRATAFVAAGALLLALVAGLVVGFALPDLFLGEKSRLIFVMFVATALSISSLPVMAKILTELGMLRRDFGQINLAAGMADDMIGWILIGIIGGLAASGSVSIAGIALSFGGVAVLLLLTFTVGQKAVDAALKRFRLMGGDSGASAAFGTAIMATLALSALAQFLGLESVLGAFLAGVILGKSRFQQHEVLPRIESLTNSLLAPVFFVIAGLRIDLGKMMSLTVLFWALVVIVAATIGKVLGAFLGARLAGLSSREGIALGAGLNVRGAMGIIIASVGLRLGVLNEASYGVIVLMSLVTSMIAPPSIRAVVKGWRGNAAEQQRLDREEALDRNLVVKTHRLLLPSRGRPNAIAAAQIVHFTWPLEVPVTLFQLENSGGTDIDDTTETGSYDPATLAALRAEAEQAATEQAAAPHPVEMPTTPASPTPPPLSRPAPSGPTPPPPTPGPLPKRTDRATREDPLQAVKAVFDGREIEVVVAHEGQPVGSILKESKLGFGAIAVGVAEQPRPGQLLSSVADELLLNADLPMLIVRRARNLATPLPSAFAMALVPVSGTAGSRAAKEIAFNLSANLGTGVVLSHVFDRAHPRTEAGAHILDQGVATGRELGVDAHRDLRSAAAVADGVLDAAAEHDCDLIIMGATPRQLGDRPFLGHLVEDILARADQTVVVVAMRNTVPTAKPTDADQRQETLALGE